MVRVWHMRHNSAQTLLVLRTCFKPVCTARVWAGTAHAAYGNHALLPRTVQPCVLIVACLLTSIDVLHGTYRVKDVLSEQGIVATRVDKQRGWDIAIVQVNSEQTRVGGSMS